MSLLSRSLTRFFLSSQVRGISINRSRFHKPRDNKIAQINLEPLCRRFARPIHDDQNQIFTIHCTISQRQRISKRSCRRSQTDGGRWLIKKEEQRVPNWTRGELLGGGGRSVQLSGARGQGAIAHRHHGRSGRDRVRAETDVPGDRITSTSRASSALVWWLSVRVRPVSLLKKLESPRWY